MIKIKLLAALVAGALALPAAAQTATLAVDPQPAQSGQLTSKAKADGKAAKKDRKKLAKGQDKQGAKKTKQKQDRQVNAPAK